MRVALYILLSFVVIFMISSCSNVKAYIIGYLVAPPSSKGVAITSELIKNKHWGTGTSYGVDVYMIHPRDTSHNIYNPNFSAYLLQGAVRSDTFQFSLWGDDESFYRTKKVYLEKEKEGLHWRRIKPVDGLPREIKTLGPLPREKWYLFDRLNGHWSYYVFVDKEGVFHVYPVLPI